METRPAAPEDDAIVQIATRIRRTLFRAVKTHVAARDGDTIVRFVERTFQTQLEREAGR